MNSEVVIGMLKFAAEPLGPRVKPVVEVFMAADGGIYLSIQAGRCQVPVRITQKMLGDAEVFGRVVRDAREVLGEAVGGGV